MEPARWERLQEIYHQAIALPESERDAFLESACAGDLDLLSDIRGIVEAYSHAGILDSPVVELGSASDSLIGTPIGERYYVESELTHGGMSQVYLANDLKLSPQQVVIKVLSQTLIENPYAQQKFDQEVEALLRMEHPGVIRVQDRGELEDGRPYIVMPYIDGVPLSSQILRAGMDLDRAASIVKQIGEALDHVHANGIFHRDLKPDNIMLRRGTDSVVLIDFGIAKLRASLIAPSMVSAIAGTVPYMSPEQLRGEKLTPASDIYSMGIVAYEMVTGRRPFNPASPSQMLEMQRAGVRVRPKQLRESLSVEADRAIMRALKFEPRARYQRAGEFGEELSRSLLAPVDGPDGIPWVKVIVGLVVLAVVSFGVYWYISHRGSGPGPTNDNIKSLIAGNPTPTPMPSPTEPSHKLTYFLTVKNTAATKPYRSNGKDDIFESGARFQLNIFASEPGFLYVFNEGPPEANDTSFTMVYPRKSNDASATLGANQTAQTDWITFGGPEGDENVWIVWSIRPVPELEDAKTEALKHSSGGLTGDRLVSVKTLLQTKKSESHVNVRHYKAGPKTEVKGESDLLITLAQFQHR